MLEKEIENAILTYLNYLPNCFAWKNQNTAIYDPTKKLYRSLGKFQFKGISDIIGIYKARPLFIEVKTPKTKNNLTLHQKEFLNRCTQEGAIAFVACSIDDVKSRLLNEQTSKENYRAITIHD
jgi:penicillin-binding protein-related factor A (putative recombinase)